uniref:Uncharacterized protein n=1 Tax=Lepeophtheirus salmonis TaxID=72036 RepID=A0A0K2ULR8_LEPSM
MMMELKMIVLMEMGMDE